MNEDEYINQYWRHHKKPGLDFKTAKKEAKKLYWSSKTLYDAYQLGKRDKDGKIIENTKNILSIKDEYINMFSKD